MPPQSSPLFPASPRCSRIASSSILFCAIFVFSASAHAQDTVEFLNGSKAEGKILAIRTTEREFDFQTEVGGKTYTRTYPYGQVHAVVYGGKRFELTALDSQSDPRSQSSPARTPQEITELIETAGSTPPSWYEKAQLNYPQTLDLDWPIKPEGNWNNQKNVGQFIWDVVNPNESRWQSGIKLVHHCLSLHKDDPTLLTRDMEKLAAMYFTLLQDYPRAAFWYQKAGVAVNASGGIHLAECYWRLGNKEMALSMMRGKPLHLQAIKLLGDMGETKDAVRVAEIYGKTTANNEAFLAAGDALRKAQRFDEAIDYYNRVIDSNDARNKDYEARYKARAAGAIEAIRLFDKVNVSQVADGTYLDSSTGYNGELKVRVNVANSRIEFVEVTSHSEKQYYAALSDTAAQIISKQSVQDIDGTSGATITSQAIIHATAKALAQGVPD